MDNYYFGKVCLIEDNPIDVLLLKQAIHYSKFAKEVIVFEGPAIALNWFKTQAPQTNDLPEMIFLDLNMPKYNGFELIDKMSQELHPKIFKQCQFSIVTSSSDPNDIIRSTTYKNVLAYLTKPVEVKDLQPENFLTLKENYFRQRNMMW